MAEVADNSNGGSAVMSQGKDCTDLPNAFPGSVLDPLEPLRRLKDTTIIINQIMSFPSRQIHHDFSFSYKNTPSHPPWPLRPSKMGPWLPLQTHRQGFWEPGSFNPSQTGAHANL